MSVARLSIKKDMLEKAELEKRKITIKTKIYQFEQLVSAIRGIELEYQKLIQINKNIGPNRKRLKNLEMNLQLSQQEQKRAIVEFSEHIWSKVLGEIYSVQRINELRGDIQERKNRIAMQGEFIEKKKNEIKKKFDVEKLLESNVSRVEIMCDELSVKPEHVEVELEKLNSEYKYVRSRLSILSKANSKVDKVTTDDTTTRTKKTISKSTRIAKSKMQFNEETFWNAFKEDLEAARKSVLIVSPFATVRRTRLLYKVFQKVAKAGVKLKIVSKPPEVNSNQDRVESAQKSLEALKKLGAEIQYDKECHQKLAVIDDKLSWGGSLNILSHRNTKEHMYRFIGEDFANESYKVSGYGWS